MPAPGTIACWRVDLDLPEERVARLARILAADERERAARFILARERRRWVVARASVRILLARMCDIPAAAIRLAYGRHGKPMLVGPGSPPPVHFSVSHSEGLALIGVARDGPLGVDIEAVRPMPDFLDVASRYFAPAETSAIAEARAHERELAFYLCWIRKEAFAKALGEGLHRTLGRCRVNCRPGEPGRILDIDGSTAAAAAWAVHDLEPEPGFVGAAVMAGASRPLGLARFDDGHASIP